MDFLSPMTRELGSILFYPSYVSQINIVDGKDPDSARMYIRNDRNIAWAFLALTIIFGVTLALTAEPIVAFPFIVCAILLCVQLNQLHQRIKSYVKDIIVLS